MLCLSVRHNQLDRILYQEVLGNEKIIYRPPEITKKGNIEIWYDREIETIKKSRKEQTGHSNMEQWKQHMPASGNYSTT